MRCSIALDTLSGAEPPLEEDQGKILLRAPFKRPTLFGGVLASVYKVNVERAKVNVYNVNGQSYSYLQQPYAGREKVLGGVLAVTLAIGGRRVRINLLPQTQLRALQRTVKF